MAYIISPIFWAFMVITSILMMPVAFLVWLVTVLFDKRLMVLHMVTSFWASLYTWFQPLWKVTVTGREKADRSEAYVIVSNHQSMVDILTLFRLFLHFKWVSKIENFHIPIIGWNMYMNRYIKLRRGSIRSNAQMIKDCIMHLEEGSSVFIFPEGTRSSDGKVRTFKEGAFEVALRTKKPILPVAVYGSSKALPARGVLLSGFHHMRIHVLDPIPYESFKDEDSDVLAARVREIILAELGEITGTSHAGPVDD